MAYKTVNLKESIPASLLFCCYLCAEVTARIPPCLPSHLGGTGHSLGLLASALSFSQHHLPYLPVDQLEPALPRADQARAS